MSEKECKKVAWGYVTRDIGKGPEVLIAERHKKDDPLRAGELVIPGGGLKAGEDYIQAAIREVKEETGIYACNPIEMNFPDDLYFSKDLPNLFGEVKDDIIYLTYKDSGKSYAGKLVLLSPKDHYQEPSEQSSSDAKNPHYICRTELNSMREKFTPACQFLLELLINR